LIVAGLRPERLAHRALDPFLRHRVGAERLHHDADRLRDADRVRHLDSQRAPARRDTVLATQRAA